MFLDPDNPALGYEALILPVTNTLESNLPSANNRNNMNVNIIKALTVPFASKGATNNPVRLFLSSEKDKTVSIPKYYSKMKVSVRVTDTSLDISQFLDLESTSLRYSLRLQEKKTKLDNSDLLHNLYTNLIDKVITNAKLKSF